MSRNYMDINRKRNVQLELNNLWKRKKLQKVETFVLN